jgi:hypothetical protein
MASVRSWTERYARHRFAVLFATLLLAIAGHAPMTRLLPDANPLEWLLALSLLAVVLSVRHGRLRRVLDGLALGFVAARLAQPLLDHSAPLHVAQGLFALACVIAAGVAVRRASAAGRVDAEHIFAALDAYMLAGIAFGIGYWLIEAALPGSFTAGAGGAFTVPRAIYFSFVTQATLGYGDIVPLGDEAQGVAVVQAVGGQIYLAVLVARLVSLYSARETR